MSSLITWGGRGLLGYLLYDGVKSTAEAGEGMAEAVSKAAPWVAAAAVAYLLIKRGR